MAAYEKELKLFEQELSSDFNSIFNYNRSRTHFTRQQKIKNIRSQAQNENVVGTAYLELNNQSDLHYNGVDMQTVG